MATKKQKRQRGQEKREREMAEIRRTGLEALKKDRQHRLQKELQEWQENHNKNHNWKKRIDECPHCRMEKRVARENAEASATSH